ncbi:MAG TPA: GFA family protein [Solimonas sp.]|nr:GFA family protein [Solimonas sp.]
MTEVLQGGCLCGAIRYHIDAVPLDAGYCHCRLCQRASGAPVVAWLTVVVGGFHYVRGEPVIFQSSAHSQREFCGSCGTALVFRRRVGASTVDITSASLDEPARIPPQYHIWRMSRLPWFETADTLPRHDDAGPDREDPAV